MKTKIRKGVFETNSSSVHSISMVMREDDCSDDYQTCRESVVTLGSGEYGWGIDSLTYWMDKADYVAVAGGYDEELIEVLEDEFPDVTFNIDVTGYIDHQSHDTVYEAVNYGSYNSPIDAIRDIVFNPQIVIIIDNDNH